jgi:molybdopterin converting factor small subunit
MRVQVKLLANLRGKLPPEARGSTVLELEPGATVTAALVALGLAEPQINAVMVNDSLEPNRQRPLAEGDALVVVPPVAGGQVCDNRKGSPGEGAATRDIDLRDM